MANETEVVKVGQCGVATYLESPPTAAIVTTNIVIAIADAFLMLFTTTTNVLFIRTYRRNEHLQTPSNMWLVVLAMSDVLVGCVCQPLQLLRAIAENNGIRHCTLWNISRLVMIFCSGMSFLTVIVITYDRYIAIFYPLRYLHLITKTRIRAVFLVCGTILLGLLLARVFLPLSSFFLIICGLTFFTTLSSLIVYSRVCLVARRQRVRINRVSGRVDPSRSRSVAYMLREAKTTRVMIYILGALVVCYYPGTCFWIYSNYHGYSLESLYTVVPYLELALFANSAINPVVYVIRCKNIRVAFFKSFSGHRSSTSF